MMASLFLLMTGVIGLIYGKQRRWAFLLLITTLVLCWWMLAHHATSRLGVEW